MPARAGADQVRNRRRHAERLHAKLPHSLLGVFFTNPSTEGAARWKRDVFLQTYKEVKDFPLLRLTAEGFEEVT